MSAIQDANPTNWHFRGKLTQNHQNFYQLECPIKLHFMTMAQLFYVHLFIKVLVNKQKILPSMNFFHELKSQLSTSSTALNVEICIYLLQQQYLTTAIKHKRYTC